ncbi:hypothetical protein HO133_002261 [Letharia lupina]|uniref:Actin-like ATPase domain-containing protein n=1 Tax=Letharia lupina TaxID=560253 RepID=A0A8H6FAX7_9LECA|nr:uncharacterized protein HO133_002261 [Letharia lupina]KAF6221406.1 hypothetical protein HO133_002261 [Letharia lupina]
MPKTPPKPKKSQEQKKPTTATKSTESPTPKPKRKRQETKKATKEPDRKILVAVDFGTTFSGIAWAQTRQPEVPSIIIQWPDATSDSLEGVSSDKVPTEITYDGENYRWGFQIKDPEQRHQWFKLALDSSQARDMDLASQYTDPRACPPPYDAEKLATDFMTALRQHTVRVLRHNVPESALLSTPIEYIITVPAMWSDMAQAKTRACAEAAGMGAGAALHIVSEPEAAAFFALPALDPHGIKIGDTFMICDAGGGTVDLITYKVSGLKPILKLAEASPGSGSACGATILNRRFREYLEGKLANEDGYDDEVLDEAMKRFEGIVKRQFRGTFGEEFQIPGLADNKKLGIRKNKMTLSGIDVRAIFEPVVKEVLALVTGQIKAARRSVKAIVLVGGFGQNSFLRDAIREEVKSSNVEVLQSPCSWTAVVRGALMMGLASTSPAFATVAISGRSARKYYGTNCGLQYLDLEHGNARKIWDACSGFYRTYMMDWFIEKGSLVKEDRPVRLSYQRKKLVSRGSLTTISTTIYCSSDPQNSGAPKYVEDESVTPLVKVEADLSRLPAHQIPRKRGADGKMYYHVDYAIQVTYMSAYTSYELICGGVNYGRVTSEYV